MKVNKPEEAVRAARHAAEQVWDAMSGLIVAYAADTGDIGILPPRWSDLQPAQQIAFTHRILLHEGRGLMLAIDALIEGAS